ncbi:MAG: TM0106 family RecB-like putative nuclease [Desulfuromonadales bacterium]
MQKIHGNKLYSASDLVNFLECEHLTTLDLVNLDTPLPKAEDDEQAELIQKKGLEHEARYLQDLQESGVAVFDAKASGQSIVAAAEATKRAMAEGVPVIFQGCLHSPEFVGYVDFLRRVDHPSGLGNFSYEVVDTKLARSPKAKFIIQLCLYSDLLSVDQGFLPHNIHVVLGDRTEQSYRLADYYRYYRSVKARFLERMKGGLASTYPEPCAHCDLCHWRNLCQEQWTQDDHLCQVANITKIQIDKLRSGGITTLAGLAQLKPDDHVPTMQDATFQRLRRQAALQLERRETGKDLFELLETDPAETKGFRRLPHPDPGDLFFDMEGDPLEEGGLEYLFGVYYHDDGQPKFQPFWAHSRQEERQAFQDFMAFVMDRLARYPNMHIYHYAPYEETALKRLMSLHGTCEAEVDHLLRSEKLVDLYKVVRESLLASEPRYSIKNLETFYMEKRTGEVTNAGASIVFYEHWKETRDPALLKQIHDYNEDDCRSTYLLREWLLGIRPGDLPWFNADTEETAEQQKSDRVHEAEARLADYANRLLGGLPEERAEWSDDDRMRELVYQLLDFHRRADKPSWWAMFARQEMTEEELIEDPEAIGGLVAAPQCPPVAEKQSLIYTYRYPEQEFKLKAGDDCQRSDTLERAGKIEDIDEKQRLVRIKRGKRSGPLPERLSVITTGPINNEILKEAVYRFADSVLAGDHRYAAIEAILRRSPPEISGLASGASVVAGGGETTPQVSEAVSRLQESYLFIQGPPGTGKTYTGSHVIVDLLEQGATVGVSSNSHKAINNLLEAVEERAAEKQVRIQGVKKSSGSDTFLNGTMIEDVTDKRAVIGSGANLVAGTAWLFADPDLDQSLDYLFIDEAGQVALANLVALGTCAKNIVLLGDQMQLQQPVQGVHPGHSGESTLDYLLQGKATIPDDQGVFLGTTWRMHQDVCRFISDAVYDGRLHPEAKNQNQRLVLAPDAHPELRPSGIRFIGIDHSGCSQRSEQEAEIVRSLYESLLGQRYLNRDGIEHPMSAENILVVAPYNMQVNLLKDVLPRDARVGTVDKFQGQQAEVVIVSMATSSAEFLPRYMEFLYSKNRLNVAISRARCLALLVANPKLMAIKCHTVEQMALVNTLCWISENSEGQS